VSKTVRFATLAVAATLLAAPAQAAVIYANDFETGLKANETVGGKFAVSGGRLGHTVAYTNNEYSFYTLALDLSDATDAILQFDYQISSEWGYDGFNLIANGAFLEPLTPGLYAKLYGVPATKIGPRAVSGAAQGVAAFDLAQFSRQVVNLKIQFASDWAANGSGVKIDNLRVNDLSSAVPEPATWAMMILGFGALGGAIRRQRSTGFVAA
jgi:hypothetical protein